MSRQLVLKQVIVVFYLLLSVSPSTAAENFVKNLNQAFQSKNGMPHFSQIEPTASPNKAYQVQKQFVDSRVGNDPVAGYKAGLTSVQGQKKFAVKEALSGVLFSSGHIANNQTVDSSQAGKLMLETEIGFILAQSIDAPLSEREDIKSRIDSVVAIVELPDLAYQNPKAIKGIDLIAANLASHQYIMGERHKLSSVGDINQIETQLRFSGASISNGSATDALGDQWQALRWLINHLLKQGYSLKAGDLLITGALGKMVPAQKGQYLATFGSLGNLEFGVK